MNKELAEILFPDIKITVDEIEAKYPARNLKDGAYVTRFGPSPTGFMHVGNLYGAFISSMLAKQTGGIFYLRIEDTDSKREKEGALDAIIDGLKAFDIDYDEGMIEKGNSIMIGGKTLVITYQPDDFFSNDSHNLVLRVKEEKGQVEEAQLYMVSALYKSLSHKYSWGNSISNKKIQADMVFLPVNSSHQIDFAFMENYIRAVKKLCVGCLKDAISRGWEREGDT